MLSWLSKSVSIASIVGIGSVLGTSVLAASAPTNALTSSQKSQAAQFARYTEHINTTSGYVSVSASTLTQHGLNLAQVAYVENTIHTYDAHDVLHHVLRSSLSPSLVSPMAYPANTNLVGIFWEYRATGHSL